MNMEKCILEYLNHYVMLKVQFGAVHVFSHSLIPRKALKTNDLVFRKTTMSVKLNPDETQSWVSCLDMQPRLILNGGHSLILAVFSDYTNLSAGQSNLLPSASQGLDRDL